MEAGSWEWMQTVPSSTKSDRDTHSFCLDSGLGASEETVANNAWVYIVLRWSWCSD